MYGRKHYCDYLCDVYDYNLAVLYSCAYFYYHHNHYDLCRRCFLNDNRIKEIRTLVNNLTVEHPKTTYLVKLLKQRYSLFQNASNAKGQNEPATQISTRSRALVFTHYRDSARKVVEILNEGGIKAARFVGQAKREFDIGMSQEEQSTVLESFRNGEFDVLVATSIAEEGLDIPEVDLVVFYEPIPR